VKGQVVTPDEHLICPEQSNLSYILSIIVGDSVSVIEPD